MCLLLYKGQGLPEYIHLYLQVSFPNCHESINHPNEIYCSLSPCLYLVYVLYLPTSNLNLVCSYDLIITVYHNCLSTKRFIIRQLRNIPLSWHNVFNITYMFHLTSTSSGRDQFNLITLKGHNVVITDILGIKRSSSMIFN